MKHRFITRGSTPLGGWVFLEVGKGSISEYSPLSRVRITIHTSDGVQIVKETPFRNAIDQSLDDPQITYFPGTLDLTGVRNWQHVNGCFYKQ